MSIHGLLDSWIALYTWDESTTNLGDVTRPLVRVSSPSDRYRGTLQNQREIAASDAGQGRQRTAHFTLYTTPSANPQQGQIVRMLSGPQAGTLWDIVEVFPPSRARHIECRVNPYVPQSTAQFKEAQSETD